MGATPGSQHMASQQYAPSTGAARCAPAGRPVTVAVDGDAGGEDLVLERLHVPRILHQVPPDSLQSPPRSLGRLGHFPANFLRHVAANDAEIS